MKIEEKKMKKSIEVEDGESSNLGTKKEKQRRKRRVKEDRLSNLPDEVIHRILSFVDATTAVQTSVLSKRWKHLWISLPVLNFRDHSFNDPFLFQCFVDHFLSRRDASINLCALNLVCHDELDDSYIVDSIVDYVTLTHVCTTIQTLNILAECVAGKLPQLSLCQSLTTLKLANIATETTTFDFVSLKHLYLFDCRFECGVVEVLDPFRGCVNLRCLFMHGCQYYGGFERFEIFAPQLVDLSISYMRKDEVFDSHFVIELCTPKLRSFSYRDSDLYDFSTKVNLPFVEKVDIVVDCLTKDADLSLQLIDLFEVMGSAKFVSLSPGIIEVLAMFPALLNGRSSPFNRVQTFELNIDTDRPSSFVIPTNVMAYLFGGSPGFNCYGWGAEECKPI